MPAGANQKREREYQELEKKFKRSGRYKGREEEVAARIVNKQRAQYGETRAERQKDKAGKSPDRGLPISDYQGLTIAQVSARLERMAAKDIRKIRDYEVKHKNRKGLITLLDRRLRMS
jgi:hypothetical protein